MAIQWIIASENPKKIDEIKRLVGDRVDIVMRPSDVPEVIEDAPDFVGNAMKKAVEVSQATRHIALADDSGLLVEALGGEPGVRSARFGADYAEKLNLNPADFETSDALNVAVLLNKMRNIDARDRIAHFETVMVLSDPAGASLIAHGRIDGAITTEPRGSGGFGYDPVFELPSGLTFAEMDTDEKNEISHRSIALRELVKLVNEVPGYAMGGPVLGAAPRPKSF